MGEEGKNLRNRVGKLKIKEKMREWSEERLEGLDERGGCWGNDEMGKEDRRRDKEDEGGEKKRKNEDKKEKNRRDKIKESRKSLNKVEKRENRGVKGREMGWGD